MALLRVEFPSLTFVEIPGYDIKFGKNRAFTIFWLTLSIPKILIRIKREKEWLEKFVNHEKPHLVVSDNRYGLVNPEVFCVFVTHQLLIKTPFGWPGDRLLQRLNYRLIQKFSQCWVPDIEEDGGLAGGLSHPVKMPHVPVHYIGWLSRFGGDGEAGRLQGSVGDAEAGRLPGFAHMPAGAGPEDYILVLLSGPEPQRTLLETIILRQAAECPRRLVLIRGLPEGGKSPGGIPQGVVMYDHLPAPELELVIRQASVVIARPGYSTVMDLARMGKNAALVPTPGQTEQEYLGRRLAALGYAVCIRQQDFSLAKAIVTADSSSFRKPMEQGGERLSAAIQEALRSCCYS